MSFWSDSIKILNPFAASKKDMSDNESISTLILEKNVERINELIKQGKICDFYSLAMEIYFYKGSYELLNELDIDSSDLIETAKRYLKQGIRSKFIEQVTSIKFEDLYQEALKSFNIEFISNVAVIGLTHDDASFNHVFTLAQHVIATKKAKDIYNFANSVLSSAIKHYTKSDYLKLVETLENAIIETEDTNYIAKFAQDIESENKARLITAFLWLKANNKEANNSKEENDATKKLINLAIESQFIRAITTQILALNILLGS